MTIFIVVESADGGLKIMFEPISFEEFINGRVCRSEARLDYDDYLRSLEEEEVDSNEN